MAADAGVAPVVFAVAARNPIPIDDVDVLEASLTEPGDYDRRRLAMREPRREPIARGVERARERKSLDRGIGGPPQTVVADVAKRDRGEHRRPEGARRAAQHRPQRRL